MLQRSDNADILNCDIPEYFNYKIPAETEFVISNDDTLHLKSIQNGRTYRRGQLQHIFAKGLKDSNKHCVLCHRISSAHIRRKKYDTPLFQCRAHCKFSDCPVEVQIKMLKEGVAKVQYKGQIKHKTTEEHTRPIRKSERNFFKEKFRNGANPLKHFLENFHKKKLLNCFPLILMDLEKMTMSIGRKQQKVDMYEEKMRLEDQMKDHDFIQKISAKP